MKTVNSEEMRRIEDKAASIGVSKLLLMENAGSALARFIIERFSPLEGRRLTIICGTGNNGGDGLVCARRLEGLTAHLEVFLLGQTDQVRAAEAKTNLGIILRMNSIAFYDASAENFSKKIADSIARADIIIDAIFGIGVKGAIKEPHSSVINMINASKALKVAVDVPSGLDPDTGEVHDKAVKADYTLTFHAVKRGLLGNKELTGRLVLVPIGIPPEAEI